MEEYRGENLIYLISQPRAGSTLLQRVLSAHPDVFATAEPWIMLHPLFALEKEGIQTIYGADLAREGLEDFLGALPKGRGIYLTALRKMSAELYTKALSAAGKKFFLDKTPRYYHVIEGLHKVHPAAKTILLFRNPLAVLASIITTWVSADWSNIGLWREDLRRAPQHLIQAERNFPDWAYRVRYEDYVAEPETETAALCRWLGIGFQPEMLQYDKYPRPAGRMGDPVGIHRYDHPVAENLQKWTDIQDPVAPGVMRAYLHYLGSDTITAMGYDFRKLEDRVARLPHVHDTRQQAILKQVLNVLCFEPAPAVVYAPDCKLEKQPVISAIVSTYQAERFIEGCLEDLEAQTISDDLEIVVVDSGSPEKEVDVVRKYQQQYANIVYIRTDQREGVYKAWNRGIKLCRGVYVTNANADDRHRPDAFEKLVAALEDDEQAVLAYGNSQVTAIENATMESAHLTGIFQWPPFNPILLFRGNYIGPHPVWRRSVHDRYGWFDEELLVAGDYDFWLRMAWDEQFIHVDEPLGLYLNAPGSIEHANLKQSQKEVQMVRNRHWRKEWGLLPALDSNFFVPVEQPESKTSKTSNQRLPIIAIIAAYNEGDVIYHIIRDLVEQDIQVVFIDHHSSDNTLLEVRKWEGKGVVRIESFPEDAGLEIPRNVYSWRYILQRKQEIAAEMGPGWYLHTDADEFRESPWRELNLRKGIERVDREGFNAINFKIYDFKPTNDSFEPGQDVREYLTHYDPDIHAYNNVQIKCWKNFGQEINLWKSGGHDVVFKGRKIYPVPFILRHYAIRSQRHGLQKIFQERKNRYDIHERKARWHNQYDQVEDTAHNFLCEEVELIPYNRKKACREALPAGGFSNNSYYEFTRPEVQVMVSPGSRVILDVGCASGRMAGEIKSKLKAEVWGIEPLEDVARHAERLLDRVIVAPVEQAIQELPDGYFDCVIFADVLEHLQDPDRVLIGIKPKLKPTGEIVVSIPNVRHWSVVKELLEGRWEYVDAGILDRTHLRFFTRQSVLNLFKKTGFHIHDMQATTFGSQEIPAGLVQGMERSGLQTGTFVEDANHYQYLIKGGLTSLANAPQQSPNLVSIIILTFNELEYTKKCVNSIHAHTHCPHEIVFVDNGSTDGTLTYLKKLIASNQNCRLITNSENRGFAAGNNQGIEAARGDYILLMNNDLVVTPGWLERMVTCAERDPRIGIVGPMSNSVSGPQQVKDVTYNLTDLKGLDEYAAEFSKRNAGKSKRFMRVVGFCMLIKRIVIDKIGGLDTSYGLGNFEDDDFSLRAALAGFESWMAKDCFIHHFGNRTFIGANIDYNASLGKNWKIFKKKWGLPTDLQLGSKYYWTQILKKGFVRDKHYYPINQGNSKGTTQKAVSSPLSDTGPLKEKYQKIQQLVNNGRQEEAIGVLERLLEMNPDFALAHNDLGILYYNQGDKEKALNYYEQAVRIEPHNLTFQKNLADFYFVESGRIDDALAIYNKVLEADFGDVEALMAIGLICASLNRPEDARHFYNRVLDHEPWNVDARRQLESLYPN